MIGTFARGAGRPRQDWTTQVMNEAAKRCPDRRRMEQAMADRSPGSEQRWHHLFDLPNGFETGRPAFGRGVSAAPQALPARQPWRVPRATAWLCGDLGFLQKRRRDAPGGGQPPPAPSGRVADAARPAPSLQLGLSGPGGRCARRVTEQRCRRSAHVAGEYSEAVLFHAGSLSPKQLAFITNGFARALVPDRDVFRRLADRAIEKASDFEPRDVALLLNGYARLQFRDLVLFEHFSKEICSRPADGYGEQQLSLVANAYARLDISDRKLFQRLGGWIAARSPELTPQGLATVMNAYAKIQIRDTKLFEALATSVRRLLPELSPQHLANVLNAYAKLQIQDTEVLEVVVSQVPRTIQGFGPIEVAATLHAITALEIGQPALTQALTALASAVQERAEEFRARQFAGVLHAFSTLNTTYGRMLADLAPHVVQCLSDADDQSLSVMFCAYARAGQPVEHVIAPLLERLEPLVATVEPQGLVQLFYACGRLGLHREKLVRRLAQLLQRDVTALSPQHVANCAYAVARLGLETEECAALLGSLQVQLARGSLSFEPQHCVNILHALAAVHGVGSPTQDVAVPLAGTVVPAIVKQALALDWRGPKHAQLLASATVSCARLREASAQLFSLAARTVQLAGTGAPISRQGLADLLGAFTATRFFDLDLFAWVLSRFSLDRPGAVQIPAILGVVGALDHASHSFVDSEDDLAALGRLPVAGADGAVPAAPRVECS
ncbi:unnamed protein product [Prorocentrum cordatum]|uniref:RNA-editing substrate-binding complex 8 protein HEAT repeats domain-containing protein n=1 Tax=Prorocentrum cordatum TaxID=2364126 RepID=A0ABN9TVC4_9DINO|nr:unnamed protein product [Polarella glacialis]